MRAERTHGKGSSVLFHNNVFGTIHYVFERGSSVQLVENDGRTWGCPFKVLHGRCPGHEGTTTCGTRSKVEAAKVRGRRREGWQRRQRRRRGWPGPSDDTTRPVYHELTHRVSLGENPGKAYLREIPTLPLLRRPMVLFSSVANPVERSWGKSLTLPLLLRFCL